ncbi:DNA polymerase subunit gamma-2, mitochondrial isoform X2 [Bufo bufo]|uniref:DNA polymerase subunit gamma-2, mitochondrial isoform X2 n=1 Tax=Bufo bufo TaxID=8384 RepID=UPI001ABE03DB|nr:DNA polymerase subunit gamma-2, mitochondrial isoform X2 [Bufo bufo]
MTSPGWGEDARHIEIRRISAQNGSLRATVTGFLRCRLIGVPCPKSAMSSCVVRGGGSLLQSWRDLLRPHIRLCASTDPTHDALLDVCRRRRFFLGEGLSAASVLGGGLGPLGVEMKKNIINEWWNTVVLNREQVLPIDTALQGHPDRRDVAGTSTDERQHSPLRQDLLHGALSHYVACLELLNRKLPFGIAEVGKCFRPVLGLHDNGPRHARTGERTVASLCWFSSAKTLSQWRDYWLRHRLLWWRRFAQVPSGFSSSDHQDGEGAKTLLINYNFPWGKEPVETLRMMDDSALTQVHAGADAKLHGRDSRRSIIPHVLWLSSDLDLGLLAYLSDALSPRGKEQRLAVLKIHPSLTPVKVAVDFGKGPAVDLRLVCQGLSAELRGSGIAVWPGYLDTVQTSMEQLFIRYDEMGVMFTVLSMLTVVRK